MANVHTLGAKIPRGNFQSRISLGPRRDGTLRVYKWNDEIIHEMILVHPTRLYPGKEHSLEQHAFAARTSLDPSLRKGDQDRCRVEASFLARVCNSPHHGLDRFCWAA